MRSASATGKSARPSFCACLTCHVTLYCCRCCCCTPLVPGGWEMDRPLMPYELDVAIRDSLLGSVPGPDDMLNEFLHRLEPVARGTLRTMIHNSFANGSLPGSWNTVDNIRISKPVKDPCRPESSRPIKSLSVLLKLTEGMIHRRLSALLPHHPRQFGFAPPRSASDVATLAIGKITRGLNEFSTVEYARPGGDAPARHPRRHRSFVVSTDISTVFDTTDHEKLFGMLDRLPRLGLEPNAGHTTTCGAAMLGYALANSTPGNNSPQPWHRKAASLDTNSSSTVWMMCCTAWTASILPPHSFTLMPSHLLPQVRKSMHLLRQCNLPCHLQQHGLPSKTSKSTSLRTKLLYSTSLHTHCLARTRSISILLAGTCVFSHAQCACWTQRLIAFLILARTPPPLQSRPCYAAISRVWSHGLVRPITPCDPF
ncbi:hypothetical protein C3747_52g279 [Trypanosoma cruzi]|uniref:Reverse transcriptase domain-containing protein n=1 Tax=Trypanosoma cruzi TaxID=5693 RepID=A0A2V2WV25_TRYCR|nr:hypothetical protein C3747_52g279 [Trypanosoma cruzi]RNC40228.1 hypothetical protein TcCL_NonESM10314 [Trypanosoma cruzi]